MNKEVDQPKGPNSQGQELPKISKEKLREILGQHKRWVESGGKEGARADLSWVNLQGANLGGANLQGAHLWGVNLPGADLGGASLHGAELQGANLGGANLKGAHLWRANLKGAYLDGANLQWAHLWRANLKGAYLGEANLVNADLSEANLREAHLIASDLAEADLTKAKLQGAELAGIKGLAKAKLQNANLDGASGLLGSEFARADVTGATLPVGIREFKTLQTVAETSKNARKIFLSMLLGCAYSVLTIATTTDARLLTNMASSPLPIIRTEIPIVWFYWAAPLVLLLLYVYLHFYLGMLWEGLAGLPAKFPDGKRLDERAYPWLLNGLVRRHVARLREGRPFLVRAKELTAIFLAWWTVPLTLFAFWVRYLRRHEWVGTWWHVGLLVAAVTLGIIFYRSAARTLRADEPPPFGWKTFWRHRSTYQAAGTALLGFLLWGLSFGAIEGLPVYPATVSRFELTNPDVAGAKQLLKIWVPRAFEKLGYNPVADLIEAEVSIKPDNWTGIGEGEQLEAQIAQVKKARLSFMNLRYASAEGAFLVKADLRGADLHRANLSGANLQGADLREAKLQGADLRGAKLQGADLRGADLQGADLRRADLQGAELFMADLQGAELRSANLQGTVLLLVSQVREAHNWDKAFYSDDFLTKDFLTKLGLPSDHNQRQCRRLSLLFRPPWCHDLPDQ